MNGIKIIAIDRDTKEKIEIDDLYWFEENFVHDWGGEGHGDNYDFVIEIAGYGFEIVNGKVSKVSEDL